MKKIELISPGSVFEFIVGKDASSLENIAEHCEVKKTESRFCEPKNYIDKKSEQRIDAFLKSRFEDYSRSFFEKLLERELVKVNGKIVTKKSFLIKSGDSVQVTFPQAKDKSQDPECLDIVRNLEVELIFENEHFAIINKPANLAVHPSDCDRESVTLVDWILANLKEISRMGFDERPGIVHRLDKNTTGLMVIPKNNCAHAYFTDLFKERKILKTYLAIVYGQPSKTGQIDFDIARHPSEKIKMVHVNSSNIAKVRGKARQAKTEYEVLEYFEDYSFVKAKPYTGRTHQIRVHFAAIGHPLLGDVVYGKSSKLISRHALHAHELEFEFEGEKFKFSSDLPKDFTKAILQLREK